MTKSAPGLTIEKSKQPAGYKTIAVFSGAPARNRKIQLSRRQGGVRIKVQNRTLSPHTYLDGLREGIPIGLGYLSVSFGFGIAAVSRGIPALVAVIISLSNLTSAGQLAGVAVIAASGSLIEMGVTQLIINLRYSLMSLSLSQKLDDAFTPLRRAIAGFGVTDEIFAVASAKEGLIGPRYMYGLISIPALCWTSGTLLGALAGNILPVPFKDALGIAIFGMFIAIIVPAARRSLGITLAALISAAASCLLRFTPYLSDIPEGFAVIICALIAALIAALAFPAAEKPEDTAAQEADNE